MYPFCIKAGGEVEEFEDTTLQKTMHAGEIRRGFETRFAEGLGG